MDINKLLPRLIRFRDAPNYLGMDRNRFNREVRPYVTEIPIGSQGKAFDRLDLDAWVEQYKHRHGLSVTITRSMEPWDEKHCQDSLNEGTTGTFGNKSSDIVFEKALAQSYSAKRKATSHGESRK